MTDTNDWNTQIIDEFRANEGRVGGNFEGAPLLLLHTTGARTGKERRDTHNLYLWVLTEDGLLGAIPFFFAIWLCVRAACEEAPVLI